VDMVVEDSRKIVYDQSYSTLKEAVKAAAVNVYAHSDAYEYAGVILYDEKGKLRVSVPFTAWSGDHSPMLIDPTAYKHMTIVALYHSHPCVPNHQPWKFSVPDIATAMYVGVPAFIVDFCRGGIYEYEPGVDRAPADGELTYQGRVVGSIHLYKPIQNLVSEQEFLNGD